MDNQHGTTAAATIDEQKIEMFAGQVMTDLGATASSVLALIGHRLGLYRAMIGAGRLTPAELAARSGTHERYVTEWLKNQAAGGYVDYDPEAAAYELPMEHGVVLADENSPVYLGGGLEQMVSIWADEERIEAAFQSGDGVGWHDHDAHLFGGVEAMFKPAYRTLLANDWIPALDGVSERLDAGGRVADVGCGHGASSIVLAEAFPKARIVGFDYHDASIATARRRAAESGIDDGERIRFQTAGANDYPVPDGGFDLICFFDSLHEFGDPVAAAIHAREALADDGTVMAVELRAADHTEDNLHPMGRLAYAMSTLLCTPNALSQQGPHALGGMAGPAAIGDIFAQAGFTRFGQVAEAPIQLVFEARP